MIVHQNRSVLLPSAPFAPDELQGIAGRIKARDRLLTESAKALSVCTRNQWLENGRDLLKAKKLLEHGEFGPWCEKELGYSKRTAEKYMRAAELFGPLIKNEPGSHLPCLSLVYLLSAKSVPAEIFKTFAHRVVAGENVRRELQAVIKKHRETVKRAKALAKRGPEATAKLEKREAAKARRDAREDEQQCVEREQREKARGAALDLLVACMGTNLHKLIELADEAGSAELFAYQALKGLKEHAQMNGAPAAASTEVAVTDEAPAGTPQNESEAA
ncbi:DUF3102 domain-containing protein [Methylobacterium sp. W2]|uniref:DUF3102 domain-containing protein n=1 Tax=Methylobacterium sp. W2 TaxID=2598107 RepID=UPI001D0CB94A|nr:DUF3102 domain-containing protein [Methylobacterium sp. W2]